MERSSSIPLMVLTASSILSATSISTSREEAPGTTVVMATVGNSTLGKRSTPRLAYPAMPSTTITSIITVAKMGRLTLILASHCMGYSTFMPSRTSAVSLATIFSSFLTPAWTAITSPSRRPSCTSRSSILPSFTT